MMDRLVSAITMFFYYDKEDKDMDVIYATLIIKGKKTFDQVPDKIKDRVKAALEDLDCGHLAE